MLLFDQEHVPTSKGSMKYTLLVIGAMMPLLTEGQGTVFCSNILQTNFPAGRFSVASDSWIAQDFSWEGTSPFTLVGVELLIDTASGSPSNFSVAIYTLGADGPGEWLGNLRGDSDPNPQMVRTYFYYADGITLSPGSGFFVVMTSDTAAAQGAYQWFTAFKPGQFFNGSLRLGTSYFDSSDGVSWSGHVDQDLGLIVVTGTPVPEPSSIMLLFCGVVSLLYFHWRRKSCARMGGKHLFAHMVEPVTGGAPPSRLEHVIVLRLRRPSRANGPRCGGRVSCATARARPNTGNAIAAPDTRRFRRLFLNWARTIPVSRLRQAQ